MPARTVVMVWEIDVDWDLVRISGRPPTSGICPACSTPLENILGAFSQDSLQAATFALHFLTFLAATALAVYSYIIGRRHERMNYFGLRRALLLFIISRLFAWIYAAVPNAMSVGRGYIIFFVVPSFFQFASQTVLIWTLTRMVCQPLVVANRYGRAKGVGLGLTIPYGIAALGTWAWLCCGAAFEMMEDWSSIVFFGEGDLLPYGDVLTDMVLSSLGALWGIVIFSLAIRGVRTTKSTLEPVYRIVPKAMIAASTAWVVRELVTMIASMGMFDLALGSARVHSVTPLIRAVFIDLFGLAVFGILFLCYRPHLAPLYTGNGGYTKSNNGEYNYAPEGANSTGSAVRGTESVELEDMKIQQTKSSPEVK